MNANSSGDNGVSDFNSIFNKIRSGVPFSFVRFSDGEIEILRNRKLIIEDGSTYFRGLTLKNDFPSYDSKRFVPGHDQGMRRDLIRSAIFKNDDYFKGIPTWHNDAVHDREFLLRLNGGYDQRMTFADLFVNSNYLAFRSDIVEFLRVKVDLVFFISNFRAQIRPPFLPQNLISIPDDFFSNYACVRDEVLLRVNSLPRDSIVLSSASSLSNVVGMKVRMNRDDITFLDVGTAINDLLGLRSKTRAYHDVMFAKSLREKIRALRVKSQRRHRLRW